METIAEPQTAHRTVPRVAFDEGAVRQWLASPAAPGDPEWSRASELGFDEWTAGNHPYLALYMGDLLAQLVDANLYDTGRGNVHIWPTCDADGNRDGCLLTVDLPDRLRLASNHISEHRLLRSSDDAGVDAAIGSLNVITDYANTLIETYERTGRG